MLNMLKKFVADEKGLETVEYAIIGALITIAAIIAIGQVGTNVKLRFEELRDNLAIVE